MKILQCYDKLVTNMTLGCSELVKLSNGCDMVVTRFSQGCYKVVVTRLSPACDRVARTLQPCHTLVISVWYSIPAGPL